MNQVIAPFLIATGLIVVPLAASGQTFAVGELTTSSDTEGFRAKSAGVGLGFYTSKENVYDRLAYRKDLKDYSGTGFSTRAYGDTLFAARQFSTGSGMFKTEGEISRVRVGSYGLHTLGAVQISGTIPGAVNYEARFEKNLVESVASLARGVTYSAYTLAADYEVTPRFVLAGVAGRFNFSDGNDRPLARAKAIYVVSEDLGLSVYASGRRYSDSQPYTGNYFSPDEYQDYRGGLKVRRRVGALNGMLSANFEAGQQNVDGAKSPVRAWEVRLESFPNRPWRYDLSLGLSTSAGVSTNLTGRDYEYRYARASVVWPFQ